MMSMEYLSTDTPTSRICFDRHSDEYDFFDSDFAIDVFLTNVRSRFVSITNGMVKTKCSLLLINMQAAKEARFSQKTRVRAKLKALMRIVFFLNIQRKEVLMKAFFMAQFRHCLLIWMFHGRKLYNQTNELNENSLRIICSDNTSS